MVGIKGQGQGRAKGQIHLIGYNFASNCHRDFKLASHFSLQKAATNMTLTSSLKVQIFETYQLRKTCQNMLGYHAQGIINYWHQRSRSKSSKRSNSLKLAITSHLIVTETFNLFHILIYKKPHRI